MNDESYRKLLSSNHESVQALERATRFVTQSGDCISFDRQRFIGEASGLGQHIDKRFDDVMESLRVMQDLPQRPRISMSQTPDERYARQRTPASATLADPSVRPYYPKLDQYPTYEGKMSSNHRNYLHALHLMASKSGVPESEIEVGRFELCGSYT